ncbi:MAG: DUF3987 domain-containing protein [Alsobacter sp.]
MTRYDFSAAVRPAGGPQASNGQFRHFGSFGTTPEPGDWDNPDLSYLGSGRAAPPEFPLALLGEFWGSFCEAHAKARFCPSDYVAAALLASASTLIGNSRWPAASNHWSEPPILWFALVGGPSSSKSVGMDPATNLLRKVEAEAVDTARGDIDEHERACAIAAAENEKWRAEVKTAVNAGQIPPPKPAAAYEPEAVVRPQCIVSDVTPEKLGTIVKGNPRGVLSLRDELSGWISGMGRYSGGAAGERSLWLEAYGGRQYRIDRQKNPEPIIVPNLSVGVLGTIQPDRLDEISGGADDGLSARFLWCWPDPRPGFSLNRDEIDEGPYLAALSRLYRLPMCQDEVGQKNPGRVFLAEEAASEFEQFVRAKKHEASRASGLIASAIGKAQGHALRLALVLEFLQWCVTPGAPEPQTISRRSLIRACGLMDGYFGPMARRVFADAAIPVPDRDAGALAKWLRDTRLQDFNGRDARRAPGSPIKDAKRMDAACNTLVEAGLIRTSPAAGISGRPRKAFLVNPKIQGGDHV